MEIESVDRNIETKLYFKVEFSLYTISVDEINWDLQGVAFTAFTLMSTSSMHTGYFTDCVYLV